MLSILLFGLLYILISRELQFCKYATIVFPLEGTLLSVIEYKFGSEAATFNLISL